MEKTFVKVMPIAMRSAWALREDSFLGLKLTTLWRQCRLWIGVAWTRRNRVKWWIGNRLSTAWYRHGKSARKMKEIKCFRKQNRLNPCHSIFFTSRWSNLESPYLQRVGGRVGLDFKKSSKGAREGQKSHFSVYVVFEQSLGCLTMKYFWSSCG